MWHSMFLGHTYEREEIEDWLSSHDTSPKTNEPLGHKTLIPNINIRRQVVEYNDMQGTSQNQQLGYRKAGSLDRFREAIRQRAAPQPR